MSCKQKRLKYRLNLLLESGLACFNISATLTICWNHLFFFFFCNGEGGDLAISIEIRSGCDMNLDESVMIIYWNKFYQLYLSSQYMQLDINLLVTTFIFSFNCFWMLGCKVTNLLQTFDQHTCGKAEKFSVWPRRDSKNFFF